ncbi:MAG: hypothetical protein M3268_02770 [Acidobacteriota bacterium]|nr:hypothetical protein [Acidobacteriota bacterium]
MENIEQRDGIATAGAREDVRDDAHEPVHDQSREDGRRATVGETSAAAVEAAHDYSRGEASRGFLAAVFSARTAYLFVGALVVGAAFGYLQFSTPAICCGDLDGYYHIRWSQLLLDGLRHGHFPPQFTWLPLTTLNARDYVDHHFLFHLLQSPFTQFGNEILGAKISAWLFASLAVFSCYWLMVRNRVAFPLLWLAALLGSSAPFLFRMNMTKAMSFSIVLLVVGINLLFRRKYIWLLPLAFVFTLAYDIFVLLGVAAVVWACVVAWGERRFEWRPVVWVGIGVALGLVINPYFPHNIRLLYEHVVMKIGVTDEGRPSVGNEWYPYDSWVFLGNCVVAFLSMFVGYVTFRWEDRPRAMRPLFFLVLSTLLLVANAKWRRFAEYFPPFAVLFAAFSIDALWTGARTLYGRLPEPVMDDLRPFLDSDTRDEERARERRWRRAEVEAAIISLVLGGLIFAFVELAPQIRADAVADVRLKRAVAEGVFLLLAIAYPLLRGLARGALTVAFLSLFVAATFTVWIEGRTEIKDSAPPEEYRAGIEWIRQNVPPGEIVFNTDWDDFPKLFFYDPTHAYVSGLDPTYLYDYDHDLSKLYESITLGKEKDPGPLIRDRFHARYVFTDNDEGHDAFYNAALDSGWFEVAFEDKDDKCNCTVLRIRDKKGEPPPDSDKDSGDGDDDSDEPDNDNSARKHAPAPGDQLAKRSNARRRDERGEAHGE